MSASCVHPRCDLTNIKSMGYCNAHYLRRQRGTDMDAPMRVKYASNQERFWEKVDKSDDCWTWAAFRNTEGYGMFYFEGRPHRAHRVSYAWANGRIPDGIEIDHTCHNRACVKPSHLRAATSSQNGQNLRSARSDSGSGVRGVSWYKTRGVWRAESAVGNKRHFLGYFTDIKEAEAVVTAWRREHMPYSLMDQKKAE